MTFPKPFCLLGAYTIAAVSGQSPTLRCVCFIFDRKAVSLRLIKHYIMKMYGVSACVVIRIFNLGTG
jgi:hypothetical protein